MGYAADSENPQAAPALYPVPLSLLILFSGPVRSQPDLGSRQDHAGMDNDDEVLLATSDEESPSEGASPEPKPPGGSAGSAYGSPRGIDSHRLDRLEDSDSPEQGVDDPMILGDDDEGGGDEDGPTNGGSPERQQEAAIQGEPSNADQQHAGRLPSLPLE